MLACLLLTATASADTELTTAGEGAGQTREPKGLAVDQSSGEAASGRLYVADRGNNRIDVLDAEGHFAFAFGWGVDAADPKEEVQVCTTATGCLSGVAGDGAGQLDHPSSVAVDSDPLSSSFHDVYVADEGNRRLEKFDPDGHFLLAFGEGEFSPFEKARAESGSEGIRVAVGPGGVISVADVRAVAVVGTPAGGREYTDTLRWRRYESSGGPPVFEKDHLTQKSSTSSEDLPVGFALDSAADAYVVFSSSGTVCKYAQDGEKLAGFRQAGCISGGGEDSGLGVLATDPADHLFVVGRDLRAQGLGGYRVITEYDAAGTPLRRLGYGILGSLSSLHGGIAPHPSAHGDIYISDGEIIRYLSLPSGPLIAPEPCTAEPLGNTKATLTAEVNPEDAETDYRFEYVDQDSFETEGGWSSSHKVVGPAGSLAAGASLQLASTRGDVIPETTYRCRVVVNHSGESATTGPEGEFTTKDAFEFGDVWSSEVGPEAATLRAEVNPLGIPATGRFEYVDDADFEASGFADAVEAPVGIDFGAGEAPKLGSVELAGLRPRTVYHYRVVVADAFFPAGKPGPEGSFRTRSLAQIPVPDDRSYEQVSPPSKNSADLGVPAEPQIQASSPDGESVTFTSFTAFGDAKSAPVASQYLAERGQSGWRTRSVNVFGHVNAYEVPFVGFTPDLRFGAVESFEPPLTGDCPVGLQDLYWQDTATGAVDCLTSGAPGLFAGVKFCAAYGGASADGSQVLFLANGAFAGAPKGLGFRLYSWSKDTGVSLVSVLPGDTTAPATEYTDFGPGGSPKRGWDTAHPGCHTWGINLRHAISADGRRIFWTYVPNSGPTQLFARIEGTKTVQLDAPNQGVGGEGGEGRFWDAAADGSKIIFTDARQLTANAPASGSAADLYRYDFDRPEGERLTDLTVSEGNAAGVMGVLGAGDDGSYVYFAAGPTAAEGRCSSSTCLYLWQEGEGVRFISPLAGGDASDWSVDPAQHTSRATPDGRYLAFTSIAPLLGYDNTVEGATGCQLSSAGELTGDKHCAEVYLYDAETDTLSCASCAPTGQRPLGPASLPGWSNPFEGPRYLSADGSRLFFQTMDGLVAEDENTVQDVYEYERPGAGSCGADSPGFSPITGGCQSLISGGKGKVPTYLLDASADGRDVFMSTRDQLLPGRDGDENYDVYDFREGGGFPEVAAQSCRGEAACRGPAGAPPTTTSSGTASFRGTGNVVPSGKQPRQCRKGQRRVRRHGKQRCVRARHARHRRHRHHRRKRRHAGSAKRGGKR